MKTSPVLVCVLALGCGGSNQTGFANVGDGGTSGQGDGGGGGTQLGGDAGLFSDSGSGTTGANGPSLIYAHTDTELYSMDPDTHAVTDIGPFSDGTSNTPTITDLAVDGSGNVVVNSETAIYTATVPASGTGTVNITVKTQLGTGTRFYALGFTPAGTLESGESLIAGDSKGDLYYIPSTGTSVVPQKLGGFGGSWELSGDVVFYSSNGATVGLATIRQCPSSTCNTKNDSLAEIDMTALKQAYTSQTPSTALLKQVLGSGTGVGDLFGIGAWGNSVYAFSREQSGTSAQLVQIGASGTGVPLQSFSNITSGWSGAGVTTKAAVTVVQ